MTILLGTKEVAERLGVTGATIRNYITEGRLPRRCIGKRSLIFTSAEIDEFITNGIAEMEDVTIFTQREFCQRLTKQQQYALKNRHTDLGTKIGRVTLYTAKEVDEFAPRTELPGRPRINDDAYDNIEEIDGRWRVKGTEYTYKKRRDAAWRWRLLQSAEEKDAL